MDQTHKDISSDPNTFKVFTNKRNGALISARGKRWD